MTNEELVAKIQAGENVQDNMTTLYQQNLPLMKKIAFPFTKFADMEDLLQEAYFGLQQAAKRYDPDRGFRFSTTINWPVLNALNQYVQKSGSSRGMPPMVLALISKYVKFKFDFLEITGTEPNDVQYCEKLQITLPKLKEIRKWIMSDNVISIDQEIPGADGITIGDTVSDEYNLEEAVVGDMASEQGKQLLWDAVAELPKQRARIIKKYFQDGLTYEELGDQFHISCERVRQLKERSLSQLKNSRKVFEAAEIFGYESSYAYKWGMSKFKDSNTSSTEYLALKHIENEERIKRLKETHADLAQTTNLATEQFIDKKGYAPIGLLRLQKLNATVEKMMQERLGKNDGETRKSKH